MSRHFLRTIILPFVRFQQASGSQYPDADAMSNVTRGLGVLLSNPADTLDPLGN